MTALIAMPTWDELLRREEYHWTEPHRSVVELSARLRSGGMDRILDLGSGAGRHTVYLSLAGFTTVGLEPALSGLAKTVGWLRAESLPVRILRGEMSCLPFRRSSFDCVISIYVMHHAALGEIRRAFAEVKRVLTPGGLFLVLIQSHGDWKYGRGRSIEANTFVVTVGDEKGVPHHFFSESEITKLLSDFEILRIGEEELDGKLPEDGTPIKHRHWEILARSPGCQPAER